MHSYSQEMSSVWNTAFNGQVPDSAPSSISSNYRDIDTILTSANELIEQVYATMSTRQPHSPQTASTSFRQSTQSSPQLRTINLNADEALVSSTTPKTSDLEREIQRINRFCDSVERNLRPTQPRRLAMDSIEPELNFDLSDSDINSTSNNIADAAFNQPTAFIDLSDSSMFITPRPNRQNFRLDNDVIILDEIVDLCSPGQGVPAVRRIRGPRNNSSRTRRNILVSPRQRSTRSLDAGAPSVTSTGTQKERHRKKHTNKSGDSTVGNESTYVCPVCMESPLGRNPTSTKCGHVFCGSCIRQAVTLTHKCPMCNTKIYARNLFRLYM